MGVDEAARIHRAWLSSHAWRCSRLNVQPRRRRGALPCRWHVGIGSRGVLLLSGPMLQILAHSPVQTFAPRVRRCTCPLDNLCSDG